MIGNLEPENLCGAEQQRQLDSRRIRGEAAIEEPPEQVPQCPEPAQHRSDQAPHQCAVALGQRSETGGPVIQLLVEGTAAAQHAVEQIGGDRAGGEAGRWRLRYGAGGDHRRHVARNRVTRERVPTRHSHRYETRCAGGRPIQTDRTERPSSPRVRAI